MVEVVDADITLPVEPGRMVPLVVAITDAVPLFDCEDSRLPLFDCVESSVELPVAVTEALPLFDNDGSRVSLEVAIKEAVRLFDCDEDSRGRFPLDEMYPVLRTGGEEVNTVGGPEGEEIAPDKGRMSDVAQRRC